MCVDDQRMNTSPTLLCVYLLIVVCSLRVASLAVKLTTRVADGAALCALDRPTLTVAKAITTTSELPAAVRCATSCKSDANCHNFNYVSTSTAIRCQLYHYQPTNFDVVHNCLHYHANLHSGIAATSSTSTTLT